MSNNLFGINIFRFIFVLLLQGLLFKYVDFKLIDIYIHPLFVLLLPLEIPMVLALILAFALGLGVDTFLNSFGLHAAVMVALAFLRPLICAIIEPISGYEPGQLLSKESLGRSWIIRYTALMMGAYMIMATLLEDLSISWLWLARCILSFIISSLFVLLYQFIFKIRV